MGWAGKAMTHQEVSRSWSLASPQRGTLNLCENTHCPWLFLKFLYTLTSLINDLHGPNEQIMGFIQMRTTRRIWITYQITYIGVYIKEVL